MIWDILGSFGPRLSASVPGSEAVARRHFVHRAHAGDLDADPAVLQDK